METTYRTVDVGGHAVGIMEAGPETAPRALFAHCSLAFAGLWRGVMERLSGRWRCVSIDMPAHGRSARGDEDLSLQLQAASYVEGVAAATGGGPVHLVGLSLGGAVMGRVAARRPALARSLTLIEPVYFHLLVEDGRPEDPENARLMEPVYRACIDGRFHDGARAFMEAWGQPGQFDRMPQKARDSVAFSLSHLAADFDMVSGWPAGQIGRDALGAIAAPTLLIHGERTQGSAKAIVETLGGIMPRAERFEVPGAGHLSPVDDPEAVAARLGAFFEAAEARG